MSDELLQVPVGPAAGRWVTRSGCRHLLAVVHTVTTGNRLLDVLPVLESDFRIQVVFTRGPDIFGNGVERFLSRLGGVVLPWAQVTQMRFDLALSAAYGGIGELHAPVMVLPHGAGFNKYPAPVPGGRLVRRGAFGLTPELLVQDGRLVPASIALSHAEQLDRLGRSCPEAVPAAVVVGDPCFDRVTASMARRAEYRRALGVVGAQKLVVVSSTWGDRSLLGCRPELLSGLAALPRPDYRVVAVLHPNIWFGHGGWQVGSWLAGCRRAGLDVVEPEAGWQAAIVAADAVVGDHGSVTFYAAAAGVPVLLGAFPAGELDPSSAVAVLGRLAPKVNADQPLTEQVERVLAHRGEDWHGRILGLVSSEPGRSAGLVRRAMYRLMGLTEPPGPARSDPFGLPTLAEWQGAR
ncbi:MAG TPA: hypothetical protein VFX70_15155 [Mycobacteriales bacterium]|nr:hypothetical protein [Mycobacteriales bacterium]